MMKMLARVILSLLLASVAVAQVNVQKVSGTNAISGSLVIGDAKTLTASGTGTISATDAPLSGITGLGTGVATFLATPTSANLAAAVTTETGTGSLVFNSSPTILTPLIAQINDANGNATLKLAAIVAATNQITIENAATGSAVHIFATGTDASIGLHLAGKGTSGYVNVQDSVDSTKRMMFNPAGGATNTRTMLSSSQTVDRILTLPDATDTLVGKATTDTLTNKTLTTPTINTITAATATDLTLNGGSSGASIVAGQGANGSISLKPIGTGFVDIAAQNAFGTDSTLKLSQSGAAIWYFKNTATTGTLAIGNGAGDYMSFLKTTGTATFSNLISTLSLAATTASTSTSTGALVVSGGIGVAGAGYFGGAVTIGADGVGGGQANKITLNYEINASSRSWKLVNDAVAFGDFAIQQSTTRTGSTYANALVFDPSLNATLAGNLTFGTSGSVLNGTTGSIGLTATGTNQNIILTPSGTGYAIVGALTSYPNSAVTPLVAITGAKTTTGTGQFGGMLNVFDTTSGNAAGVGGVISFGGNSGGGVNTEYAAIGGIKENSTYTDYAGALVMYSRVAGGSITERARINSNGNVLIGTTTNSSNGILQLATHTTSAGGIGFGTELSIFRLNSTNLLTNVSSGGFSFGLASAGARKLYLSWDGSNSQINTDAGTLAIGTLGTNALVIDTSQKVTVTATTASTSTTTGALVVSGGVGVAGAIFAGGAVVTSSATLSGAGAIPITTSLVKFTSTGAANALTLANGVDGQRLTIVHDVKGTLGTGVLTPTTKTGFSTVTFNNAGDTVSLVYVTTRGWMVTGPYLATIAP